MTAAITGSNYARDVAAGVIAVATALLLAATQWSTTHGAPPRQSLVGQSTVTRGDGAPVYFALPGPGDVSNDAFRHCVHLVVVDVAKIDGGLDFRRWISTTRLSA